MCLLPNTKSELLHQWTFAIRPFMVMEVDSGDSLKRNIVLPGYVFKGLTDFVRGHGTYLDETGQLVASVAGIAKQVNKLVCVQPFEPVYTGQVGDTVVGRVTEVLNRRWKIEINARREAHLLLTAVNLPGGVLRRKSVEDEKMMRANLCEGDMISAEVQTVYPDGSVSLQTRSLKYGKLFKGILVKVPPYLIKRCRMHFINMACGPHVIFGVNGYIWLSKRRDLSVAETGSFVDNTGPIGKDELAAIARLRMCVILLAKQLIPLFEKSLQLAYDLSLSHKVIELADSDGKEKTKMSIIVEGHRDQMVVQLAKLIKMQLRRVLGRPIVKRHVIGLSGGSLPDLMVDVFQHRTLADLPVDSPERLMFVFCDERKVAFSDPSSTYGEYRRKVIDRIPKMNARCFLAIDPSLDVDECAQNYEKRLRDVVTVDQKTNMPIISILLLGVGPDGHTCSLFPGHTLLEEKVRWVAPIKDSPKLPPERVTLTLPVIQNAGCVIFVATGASKSHIVKRVLKDHDATLPATLAKPKNNNLFWVLDEQAASKVVVRSYNMEETMAADVVPGMERLCRSRP
uniref:Ribosomal RNA-processing protein 4 n=1 Tax=Trichuris muris TaxID=70415 RepID=A0A5S6R085_TRIMR